MKTRYDKLIVIRAAASRMATAAFVDASAQLAGKEALAERLHSASSALSPETGVATGAGLASRLELGFRMQTACCMTKARIAESKIDLNEMASARRSARRALAAAVDIRRSSEKATVLHAEARAMLVKPSQAAQ